MESHLPGADAQRVRRMGRRAVLAGLCALAVPGTVAAIAAETAPDGPTLSERSRRTAQPDALFRLRTDEPLVALTFDDGPDPAFTPAVLDELARQRARATFFVVGTNARAHSGLVRQMLASGHRVANHTRAHTVLDTMDEDGVRREILGGAHLIRSAAGTSTEWFRPPRGQTSRTVGRAAVSTGQRTAFWTHCIERFLWQRSVEDAVDAMLSTVRPGDVLLLHDGGTIADTALPGFDRSRTVAALPLILEGLRSRGLAATDLDTLVRSGRGARR